MVEITSKIEAVIFDLWGTLAYIINEDEIWRMLVEDLGLDEKLIVELDKKFILLPEISKERIRMLLQGYGLQELSNQLYEILTVPQEFGIYPEVEDVLESLKENFKLGIISNIYETTARWVRRRKNTRKLLSYFSTVIFSCEVGYAKPDKEIFYKALYDLKSSAENTFMVGDSLSSDILPARSLGMQAVLIDRSGKTPCAISSLKDILKVLKFLR